MKHQQGKDKTNLFRVRYYYEGSGTAVIEARNKEEAESLFYGGGWRIEEDRMNEEYQIKDIIKVGQINFNQ